MKDETNKIINFYHLFILPLVCSTQAPFVFYTQRSNKVMNLIRFHFREVPPSQPPSLSYHHLFLALDQ